MYAPAPLEDRKLVIPTRTFVRERSIRHISPEGKTRQNKTRQNKKRQGKTRQDKTGQDKTRQDKT
jgi:hypothetical protein